MDKLFVLEKCEDGPVRTILREAKKHDTIVKFVKKERLEQLSETGMHQGVIAMTAAYNYAEVAEMLEAARVKGEPPFLILLAILKTLTIWVLLSELPIWQAPTASLFRKTEPSV